MAKYYVVTGVPDVPKRETVVKKMGPPAAPPGAPRGPPGTPRGATRSPKGATRIPQEATRRPPRGPP